MANRNAVWVKEGPFARPEKCVAVLKCQPTAVRGVIAGSAEQGIKRILFRDKQIYRSGKNLLDSSFCLTSNALPVCR